MWKMRLVRRIGLPLVVAATVLVMDGQLAAQSSSLTAGGKLSGLILDPGEARVVGARIIVEGKGFRREATSGDDGGYSLDLPEGRYKVRVMLGGFYPSRKKSVRIMRGAETKFNVTLKGIRNDESHP
jgi:hypothetical protein